MLYAVICTDKPDSLAIRKANRPDHVEFLQSLGDRLVLAGPFTEPDGRTMNGSLIVILLRLRRQSRKRWRACPTTPSRPTSRW